MMLPAKFFLNKSDMACHPIFRLPFNRSAALLSQTLRTFSQTPHYSINLNRLPPRPIISESDITECFLKGSGPGGQKINKTSSAVQLKHIPTGIVVKCQATRSRTQNRKAARILLAERLEEMEKGPQSRTALKAVRERNKRAGRRKKAKRKYGGKKLEEGVVVVVEGNEEEEPQEEAEEAETKG